jgi:hypothetical protein
MYGAAIDAGCVPGAAATQNAAPDVSFRNNLGMGKTPLRLRC